MVPSAGYQQEIDNEVSYNKAKQDGQEFGEMRVEVYSVVYGAKAAWDSMPPYPHLYPYPHPYPYPYGVLTYPYVCP